MFPEGSHKKYSTIWATTWVEMTRINLTRKLAFPVVGHFKREVPNWRLYDSRSASESGRNS